jgi:hypothetical protein
LPGAVRALESPCIPYFTGLLAHNFGSLFANRLSGFVQKFAHSWQAIADASFHTRTLQAPSRSFRGTGQPLRTRKRGHCSQRWVQREAPKGIVRAGWAMLLPVICRSGHATNLWWNSESTCDAFAGTSQRISSFRSTRNLTGLDKHALHPARMIRSCSLTMACAVTAITGISRNSGCCRIHEIRSRPFLLPKLLSDTADKRLYQPKRNGRDRVTLANLQS